MDEVLLLKKITQKKNITSRDAFLFLNKVMRGAVSPTLIGSILTAFHMKGEIGDEILGFIQAMRQNMKRVSSSNAVDVCGTGGDESNSFNISTVVAFVVAGAGISIAKHGNRAASSKCGSADVLEELGINIKLTPQQAEYILKKVGMVFLFAPIFHPSLKYVSIVRRELKIRTIFNFLGPFANPALVKKQLIGVPNKEIAEILAAVGAQLDYEHLLIVTSDDGLDEISLSSHSFLYEIKNSEIKRSVIDPTDYGFKKISKTDISGGTISENATTIKEILNGVEGPKRDIVVLNSAFSLYVSGKAKDVKHGIQLAEQSLDSGAAMIILKNLRKETQSYA